MRLKNIQEIKGNITLLTGLHIGAGNNEMHIGGSDNPVIRHPHSNEPYIPGSSIKGKIRSLLEWHAGLAAVNGGKPMSYATLDQAPDPAEALRILQLFGVSGGDNLDKEAALKVGPSRLSFRDLPLDQAWVEKIKRKNLPLTEVKMENTIDRVRGVADNPRNTERVPAGAKFQFSLSIKQLDGDGESLLGLVFIGMKLLEMDSLGGSGSRGYGRIRWELENPELQQKLDDAKPW
ncbi:MAG: type III-A CRISPR-associated RAMP protein Csm3 [Magnetococcales bacterium]|nr:type III-A CRISPR-associated RAMP protein Csm3 [Magnetococcales bacterium]